MSLLSRRGQYMYIGLASPCGDHDSQRSAFCRWSVVVTPDLVNPSVTRTTQMAENTAWDAKCMLAN